MLGTQIPEPPQTSVMPEGDGQSASELQRGKHASPMGVDSQLQPMLASDGHAPAASQSACTPQDVGPVVVPPPPELAVARTVTVRVLVLEPAAFPTVSITS